MRARAPLNLDGLMRGRWVGGAVAAVIVAVLAAGCGGSDRSTAAFCNTMKSEQQSILAKFNATANSGQGLTKALNESGASAEAISALRTYFDKLADVAPPPIEDAAKIVAKSYDEAVQDEANNAGNPLAALMSGLMNSAASSSQTDEMNQFVVKRCGHSI